jgi:hypothetical protein
MRDRREIALQCRLRVCGRGRVCEHCMCCVSYRARCHVYSVCRLYRVYRATRDSRDRRSTSNGTGRGARLPRRCGSLLPQQWRRQRRLGR